MAFEARGVTTEVELLRPTLDAMAAGSRRANAEILRDLAAITVHAGTLDRATELAAELATRQPWLAPRVQLGPSAWRDYVTERATTGPMGGSWLRDFDGVMEVVFDLYERDHGSTRRTLHALNEEEPRIPYLRVFLMHALFELDGASPQVTDDRAALARALARLFDAEGRLLAWADEKRARGIPLKAFAGLTHTVVGMYDWIARSPATGFARVPRDVANGIDLGGGYGTPDLSRLFGVPLVSHDLHSPTHARAIGLRRFQVATESREGECAPRARWQSDEEAAATFAALDVQPWRQFDVFHDDFQDDAASFLITSFGFLTSTVASHSPHALGRGALGRNVLAQMHTTYAGLRRVLTLVAKGKDVTLFTFQRATSRAYRNVTLMLRFADRRLSDHAVYEAPVQLVGAGVLPPLRAGG